MPILPRQADIFPENLLEQTTPANHPDAKWWALYTLSRREKELMRQLYRMGVPFCAPLIKKRNRSPKGRTRISHVPLFASYVFLCGDNDEREQAFKTNCVSRFLPVPDPVRLVHDLRQVQQLISLDAPLTPEKRLSPGKRVRVRTGTLAGLEGVVIQRRGQDRLLVSVKFLQQGASVQLEDYLVEPID